MCAFSRELLRVEKPLQACSGPRCAQAPHATSGGEVL